MHSSFMFSFLKYKRLKVFLTMVLGSVFSLPLSLTAAPQSEQLSNNQVPLSFDLHDKEKLLLCNTTKNCSLWAQETLVKKSNILINTSKLTEFSEPLCVTSNECLSWVKQDRKKLVEEINAIASQYRKQQIVDQTRLEQERELHQLEQRARAEKLQLQQQRARAEEQQQLEQRARAEKLQLQQQLEQRARAEEQQQLEQRARAEEQQRRQQIINLRASGNKNYASEISINNLIEIEKNRQTIEQDMITASEKAVPRFNYLIRENNLFPLNSDIFVLDEIEKEIGIKVDLNIVSKENYVEHLIKSAAANYLPDLITAPYHFINQYRGNIFLDYRKLMENSIPNLVKQFEKYPELKQSVMSKEGRWYVLPTINENIDYEKVLGVRIDVLEELGYSQNSIRTIDDFADLLLAARKSINGTVKIPWLPVGPSINLLSVDPKAFGIGGTDNAYWNGSEFTYGPSTSEYFVYLRLLALAYQTKTLPADMFDRNEETNKRSFFSGAGAIYVRSEKDMLGTDRANLLANGINSAIYRPIVPPPIGRKSYTPRRLHVLDTDAIRAINRNTSRLHEITRFLDFCYSDKGKHLIYWGRENIHWKFENGYPRWLIQTPFNNNTNKYETNGLSLGLFGSWLSLIRPNTIEDVEYGKLHDSLAQNRLPNLQEPTPLLAFTESEKQELDLLTEELKKHSESESVSFITGKRNMSKEWNTFLDELNFLGLARLKEIYAIALNRSKQP